MTLPGILFVAWLVVVLFWMSNHYFRDNQRYENEYKRGLRPRWHRPDDYDED